MEPYQIILLIVVTLLFIYVSILVYSFSSCIEFKARLKKKNSAVALIYAERKDAILAIYALFVREDVNFTDEDDEMISLLEDFEFGDKKIEEIQEGVAQLKTVQARLAFIAQTNRWAIKNEEYLALKEVLRDLEVNYRQVSANYNADVGAYNYWVSIPGCSWLPYIFGHRKVAPLH